MIGQPPSFDQLIGSLGTRNFFGQYWQRRPLCLDLYKSLFDRILAEIGPLDVSLLAKRARQGVQAWISGADISHSVFEADASTAGDFHRVGATLYFVDVALPGLTEAIAD